MKKTSAFSGPVPGTAFVRLCESSHNVQTRASAATSDKTDMVTPDRTSALGARSGSEYSQRWSACSESDCPAVIRTSSECRSRSCAEASSHHAIPGHESRQPESRGQYPHQALLAATSARNQFRRHDRSTLSEWRHPATLGPPSTTWRDDPNSC